MKITNLIIALVVMLFGVNLNTALAQKTEIKKTYTQMLDVSADEVWSVLRKMDKVDKYSSTVARVEWKGNMGVGGSRTCYSPDGKGYFKENIVSYDDTNRTFSYSVIEGVPIKGMVNTWKVLDLGYNQSMVVWYSKFDEFMKNPQMTQEQFMAFIDSNLDEFVSNVVAEINM